jgi:U3 small nucleolar RNA-associated protein 15
MGSSPPPIKVLTLLVALRHRSAMRAAFERRNEQTVQPIISWVNKHILDPRYVDICVEAALLLIDLYSEHVGGSQELDNAFKLLHRRVRVEVERSQQAIQTQGMLQLLCPTIS